MSPDTKTENWLRGKIIQGKGLARTMGYPTLNFENPTILDGYREGVYFTRIKIHKLFYNGLLYYGPRLVLGETKNILEIFVMGYNNNIYGEWIEFEVLDFIREKMNFAGLDELKKQIEKDFEAGLKIISQTPK